MDITKENFLQLDLIHLNVENRKTLQSILDILSPDYIEITKSGVIKKYEDYLNIDSLSLNQTEITNYEIKVLSPSTVLSYYKLRDIQTNTFTMRSNIWQQMNGEWLLVFHQGTKIVAETLNFQ